MKYNPSRGGHAPGHLREALAQWVEQWSDSGKEYWPPYPSIAATVGWDQVNKPIEWLLGQLWNCNDIVSGDLLSQLNELCGEENLSRTRAYAAQVRRIKAMLQTPHVSRRNTSE